MYLNLQHSPFQHHLSKLKSRKLISSILFRGIIKKDKRRSSILFIERLLVNLLYSLKLSHRILKTH